MSRAFQSGPCVTPRLRPGTTLIELLVALTILVLIAGFSLNLGGGTHSAPATATTTSARLETARRRAIETRLPISIVLVSGGARYLATAWPDGTISADSALHLSPFDGSNVDSTR